MTNKEKELLYSLFKRMRSMICYNIKAEDLILINKNILLVLDILDENEEIDIELISYLRKIQELINNFNNYGNIVKIETNILLSLDLLDK